MVSRLEPRGRLDQSRIATIFEAPLEAVLRLAKEIHFRKIDNLIAASAEDRFDIRPQPGTTLDNRSD